MFYITIKVTSRITVDNLWIGMLTFRCYFNLLHKHLGLFIKIYLTKRDLIIKILKSITFFSSERDMTVRFTKLRKLYLYYIHYNYAN